MQKNPKINNSNNKAKQQQQQQNNNPKPNKKPQQLYESLSPKISKVFLPENHETWFSKHVVYMDQ